jgi:hypothetical protein
MNQKSDEKIHWIGAVVTAFYSEAKNDILIGYHFRNIPDFEEHIPRIITFWEIQLLGKSSFKISPYLQDVDISDDYNEGMMILMMIILMMITFMMMMMISSWK